MNKIKALIKKIPLLFPLVKIIQDKRYFYHYLQGFFTSKNLRMYLKRTESKFFFKKTDDEILTTSNKKHITELSNFGYLENPIVIDSSKADKIKLFLDSKLMHEPEAQNNNYFLLNDKPYGSKRGFYQCEDVVLAPHVLDIANDPILLSIAHNYFGAIPIIDYIGSWWSFPSKDLALTQSFHRDIDTLNSLKFFVYLTDVDSTSGPHVYVRSSHNSDLNTIKDKMHHDNEIIKEFSDKNLISLEGPKGYTFIADTFGFHKGLAPKSNNRLVLQIIYTLKRTPFSPKKPFVNRAKALKLLSGPYSKYINQNIIST